MLSEWESWAQVERGLSEATISAYARELRTLERGLDHPLAVVSPDELRAWLHGRGGSPQSVARRISAIRSFSRFLVRTGQRTDDPTATLERPRVHRGLPRPVADTAAAFAGFDPETRAIATFLVLTGLRISEACAVFVRPPAPEELVVLGKGSKERRIPLTEGARAALDSLGGAIPVSARTVQRRFAKAGFSPHRLRHTLATELARADVDLSVIQDILGHASPATTRIYQANDTDRLREGLERRRR